MSTALYKNYYDKRLNKNKTDQEQNTKAYQPSNE